MGNTLNGGAEATENMGPRTKGVISNIRKGSQLSENFGYITLEEGKTHAFNPFSLASFNPNINSNEQIAALMEEFSKLSEKSKVIFNSTDNRGAFAMNLALDTSEEVGVLVPQTRAAATKVLAGTTESVENMGPKVSGTIKVMKLFNGNDKEQSFGFITPTTEGYEKDAFFGAPMCVGGMETFETLYNAHLIGEQIRVSFNVQDSAQGPTAMNVAIETV